MKKLILSVAATLALVVPAFAVDGTVTLIDKLAPQAGAFVGLVDSSQTLVNTANFTTNLSSSETTVQKALDKIDKLTTGGSGAAAGNDTDVQYNSGAAFAGSDDFIWDNTNKRLSLGGTFGTGGGPGSLHLRNGGIGDYVIQSSATLGGIYIGDFLQLGGGLTSTAVSNFSASGSANAVVVTSTGTGTPLKITSNGIPSGGLQNRTGGALNIKMTSVAEGMVIQSSVTDAQQGSSMLVLWQDATGYNDPLIWIHNADNASNPFLRADDPAPDMELVNTSTDNAHGLGKWEPMAIAYQGVNLQINSRAYDNSTFENVAYWTPLSQGGGLTLAPVLLGVSGNTSPNATQAIMWTSTNNHTVGLMGPQATTASWNFTLPSTPNNQGQVMYQATNGPNRTWEFTTGGVTGNVLQYNSGAAPTWVSSGTSSGSTSTFTDIYPATSTALLSNSAIISSATINGGAFRLLQPVADSSAGPVVIIATTTSLAPANFIHSAIINAVVPDPDLLGGGFVIGTSTYPLNPDDVNWRNPFIKMVPTNLPINGGGIMYFSLGNTSISSSPLKIQAGTVTTSVPLKVTSIIFPDGTIQVSSPTASVGSGGGSSIYPSTGTNINLIAGFTSGSTATFSGPAYFNSGFPSTFTYGVSVGSVTLNGQSNTAVIFMNGTQLASSGSFTWNGTTVAATMVRGSTITATNGLVSNGTTTINGALYFNGTSGTFGQVLVSSGAGLAPFYQTFVQGVSVYPATATVQAVNGITSPGTGTSSEHYGTSSTANFLNATALGNSALAANTYTTAIGQGSNVSATQSCAFGYGTSAAGTNSMAMGTFTTSNSAARATAVGVNSNANSNDSTMIGYKAGLVGSGSFATAVGDQANALGNAVSIGGNADGTQTGTVGIGYDNDVSATEAISIGDSNRNSGANSILIGQTATNTFADAIGMGSGASPTAINQMLFSRVNNVVFSAGPRFSTAIATQTVLIQAINGQTANLMSWQDFNASTMVYVGNSGTFGVSTMTAVTGSGINISTPTFLRGGMGLGRRVSATDVTVAKGDLYIGITDTTSPRTVTLFSTATCTSDYYTVIIKDQSGGAAANNITIAPQAGQKIDGAASKALSVNYQSYTLMCGPDGWWAW